MRAKGGQPSLSFADSLPAKGDNRLRRNTRGTLPKGGIRGGARIFDEGEELLLEWRGPEEGITLSLADRDVEGVLK